MGEDGVTVKHFFELCSEIVGQDLAFEKEEPDYYDIIVQEALEKVENCGEKYDAILVDEGQDLTDDMYSVLVALLKEKTDNLTISLDENQNIYKRSTSWKDLGIQARGRDSQHFQCLSQHSGDYQILRTDSSSRVHRRQDKEATAGNRKIFFRIFWIFRVQNRK